MQEGNFWYRMGEMNRNEQEKKVLAAQRAIFGFKKRSDEWYERALCARPRSIYFKVCCAMGDLNIKRAQALREQNKNLTPTPVNHN